MASQPTREPPPSQHDAPTAPWPARHGLPHATHPPRRGWHADQPLTRRSTLVGGAARPWPANTRESPFVVGVILATTLAVCFAFNPSRWWDQLAQLTTGWPTLHQAATYNSSRPQGTLLKGLATVLELELHLRSTQRWLSGQRDTSRDDFLHLLQQEGRVPRIRSLPMLHGPAVGAVAGGMVGLSVANGLVGPSIGAIAGRPALRTELFDLEPLGALHGKNVLLAGDSLMKGIAPKLAETLATRTGAEAAIVTRVGTGLSRPDFYDWGAKMALLSQRARFEVAIISMGTNDSQDMLEDGAILFYGSPAWMRAYEARLATFLQQVCRVTDRAFWIGLPPMKNPVFHSKADRLNYLAQRATRRSACAKFVPTDLIWADQDGGFAAYLETPSGRVRARLGDGIHVAPEGGQLLAEYLLTGDVGLYLRADTAHR